MTFYNLCWKLNFGRVRQIPLSRSFDAIPILLHRYSCFRSSSFSEITVSPHWKFSANYIFMAIGTEEYRQSGSLGIISRPPKEADDMGQWSVVIWRILLCLCVFPFQVTDSQEVYRLVYYGGVEHSIRKEVRGDLDQCGKLDQREKSTMETVRSKLDRLVNSINPIRGTVII